MKILNNTVHVDPAFKHEQERETKMEMLFGLDKSVGFKYSELYKLKFEMEIGIDALSKIVYNLEASYENTLKDLKTQIENDDFKNQIDSEYYASYYSQTYEIAERIIDEVLRLQRYSMCVAICSFIEGKLQSICAKIAKDFNLEMKPGKHYIPYYLGFLNGRYSMKMANFKVFKTQFNQLQSLRDKCTHQDGKIDKIQEREFSNVEGILIKKLGDNLQLEVTTEYLRSLISDIKKFSNNLFSAIDERYVVINSKNNESQKNIIL